MDSERVRIARGNLNPPLLEPWEVQSTTNVQQFKYGNKTNVLCLLIDSECCLPGVPSSNEHVLTLPHPLTLFPQEEIQCKTGLVLVCDPEVHATIGNCCWSNAWKSGLLVEEKAVEGVKGSF